MKMTTMITLIRNLNQQHVQLIMMIIQPAKQTLVQNMRMMMTMMTMINIDLQLAKQQLVQNLKMMIIEVHQKSQVIHPHIILIQKIMALIVHVLVMRMMTFLHPKVIQVQVAFEKRLTMTVNIAFVINSVVLPFLMHAKSHIYFCFL